MKRSMIVAVSVVAVMLAAGAAQAAIVYQTGFEPTTYAIGNLGGQDGWVKQYSGSDATVQTGIFEGTQAVKVKPSSSGLDTRYLASVLSVGPTDILTLSYDQYLTSNWFTAFSQGSRDLTVTLRPYYTDPEWEAPYYHIVLSTWEQADSNGFTRRIGFGVDGSQLAVPFDQSLLDNKWSNLRIVANNGTGIAEAFLNNVSLGTKAFTVGGITSVESIDLQSNNNPFSVNAYVDNVSLSIVPEPATMALLALGGVGLLARRRRGK